MGSSKKTRNKTSAILLEFLPIYSFVIIVVVFYLLIFPKINNFYKALSSVLILGIVVSYLIYIKIKNSKKIKSIKQSPYTLQGVKVRR